MESDLNRMITPTTALVRKPGNINEVTTPSEQPKDEKDDYSDSSDDEDDKHKLQNYECSMTFEPPSTDEIIKRCID